jgi:hypothetical protein
MRELLKDKKILSTIWTVFVGFAVLCGALTDIPKAITTAITNGPAILSSPNTWWVIGVLLVEAIVLHVIWKQPSAQPDVASVDENGKSIRVPTYRESQLAALLEDVKQLENVFRSGNVTQQQLQYMNHLMEIVYPSRMSGLINDQRIQVYREWYTHAKSQSGQTSIGMETGFPMLKKLLLEAIDEDQKSVARSWSIWRKIFSAPH